MGAGTPASGSRPRPPHTPGCLPPGDQRKPRGPRAPRRRVCDLLHVCPGPRPTPLVAHGLGAEQTPRGRRRSRIQPTFRICSCRELEASF